MVWSVTTLAPVILETIFVLITPVTTLVLVFFETTLVLVTLETNPVLKFILETSFVLKVTFKDLSKLSSLFEKMM